MKKFFIVLSIFIVTQTAFALEIKDRTITVTTTAEMLVVPDQIEVQITLKEQGGSTYLSKLESMLWEKLVEYGISKNQIAKDNVNVRYYWYYWWKNREASKKSRKMVLQLNPKINMLKLMKALDKEWISNIKILAVSNKKLDQHKKEIEIKAMKSAKEKATYLLSSIGEELGKVISVNEVKTLNNTNSTAHIEGARNSMNTYVKSAGKFYENIPEIRLKYTLKSTFEIK